MIYEYAERTAFFPTASTRPIDSIAQYAPHLGELEEIRFPPLTAEDVAAGATLVWNRDVRTGDM